jgi:hypothetical protein
VGRLVVDHSVLCCVVHGMVSEGNCLGVVVGVRRLHVVVGTVDVVAFVGVGVVFIPRLKTIWVQSR